MKLEGKLIADMALVTEGANVTENHELDWGSSMDTMRNLDSDPSRLMVSSLT